FDDVSFQVARGEIVGLGGLVGAGRSEVARAIFGVDSYDAGEVRIDGEMLPASSVRVAIQRGVALVPEDRQLQGLVAALSVQSNMTLPQWARFTRWALMSPSSERATVSEMSSRLALKAPSLAAPMTSLSGGNQQKVVVGKWLATEPRLLILDEPTRGVDVGAKAELYRVIRQLADQGLAILLISSDLPELLQLSDRIVVMRSGRVSGELVGDAATEQQVLRLALPGAAAATAVAVEMSSEAKAAAVTSAATIDATGPATTTAAERKEAEKEESAKTSSRRWLRREWGLAAVLLVCGLFVGAMNPAFLGAGNLGDLLVHAAPVAIVACGLTFVVVTGEIDISLGSLMGVCAATLGLLCGERELHWPVPLAVGAVLALGAVVGCVNGLLVTIGRVPSIIVTLGMLSVLRGVTELLMSGRWITDLPSGLRWLGTGGVLGVRFCVVAAATVFVASMIVAHAMPLGRRLYALGSNPEAARLIGLSSLRLKLGAFCMTGFLVALATVVSAPQLSVIESGIGVGFELTVVTCVVVGGVSI
ncbi:MAG TPA: ATP-binding cassette domain-containing protein, partial [Pirellulaceae bacterium]|nr:ATP-binding cassette domain-containing protein [Pirellulaceae bacterium]